ncbi:MAG: tRNA pseudouridine(55) synthase TruB [Burkholderiaceae bacterium]|nr:tRNA pseudouridine(55) synthase TruB [Burkholderiaceae bacterium]GIL06935.1 MAG: tRNA pseudouridine synthase B [Betaproteobacteria bacterium]
MAARRKGDAVDGVLLLDKPGGITSNLALQKARRLLNAAKAGHTGTLDPIATGLLPLAFGEATKFSADLLEADKEYEATLALGVRTTTADAEGEVVETRPVAVTRAQLEAVLAGFTGTIEQTPPMHSALKRDGRPLYDYARRGIEIERAPRSVRIERLVLLAFDGAAARVVVECSKGTYVRTLAEDIGAALGCGAHLAALRRTRVGDLTLERAVTLAALEVMPAAVRREWLLPVDALLGDLPRIDLGDRQAALFAHGGQLDLGVPTEGPGRRRVYGPDERLLGLAELDERGVLNPRRLISTENAR